MRISRPVRARGRRERFADTASAWRATRAGGDCATTTTGACWRSVPGPDDSPALPSSAPPSGPECRFPGCRRPLRAGASSPALAHGGPTTLSNLALLCRRHHRGRARGGLSKVARGPTGLCDSAGRMADLCLRWRACAVPEKPSRLSGWLMKSQGLRLNARRRVLAGWGSAWMWAGRSTSCTARSAIDAPLHHPSQDCRSGSMSGGHPQRLTSGHLRDADAPRLPARCRKPSPSQEPTGGGIRFSGASFRATARCSRDELGARVQCALGPAREWGVMSTWTAHERERFEGIIGPGAVGIPVSDIVAPRRLWSRGQRIIDATSSMISARATI